MYSNYFKGLKDYGKVELSLYELIEDDNKTKTNSPQLKKNYIKSSFQPIDIVIGSKYISLMPLGMFIKHLYII